MFQKALDHARQIAFLSLAVFFLVASGFIFRLFWFQEPIQALGQRLLAKDGALLISILNDPKTIRAVRKLTAPRPTAKGKKAPKSVGHYFVDRMFEHKGHFLRHFSTHLLREPAIQKLLMRTQISRSPKPDPMIVLGRYMLDQLFKQKGQALQDLTQVALREVLLQQKKIQKHRKSVSNPPPYIWNVIEKWGKQVVSHLVKKDGKLLVKLTDRALQQALQHASKRPQKQNSFDPGPLLERLGKHTVDRLTSSNAQPLRTLVHELVGPEPQRALRVVREAATQVARQIVRLQATHFVREAAYQLGRGSLEAFLKQQQEKKNKSIRRVHELHSLSQTLHKQIRTQHPCFIPKGQDWLSLKDTTVVGAVHFVPHAEQKCGIRQCFSGAQHIRTLLKNKISPLQSFQDFPVDFLVKMTPSCQELRPTSRRKKVTSNGKKASSSKPEKEPKKITKKYK